MHKYEFALQESDSEVDLGSNTKLVGSTNARKKKSRSIIFICILLIALVVALGVGLGLGLNKKDKDKPNTASQGLSTPASQSGESSWMKQPCMPPGGENHKCPWKELPLLLVSLDGFRADYLTRNLTPTLQKLSDCGVHTPYMRPVYPTLTFPNHYSIVTGLYPESHGIVENFMYDPDINKTFTLYGEEKMMSEWYGGEPIWITAKKSGKKSASYFWVGTDVNINGYQPDIWNKFNGSVPYETRVDAVLDWLTLEDRPDLILLYINDPDHAGHAYGPNSKGVDEVLVKVDNVIRRLMDGLLRKQIDNCVNVMIMADHGMEETSCDRKVGISKYIKVKDYLIFDGSVGTIHKDYQTVTVDNTDVVIRKEEGTLLGDLRNSLDCKSGHLNIYTKSNKPVRMHFTNNKRIGDVTIDVQAKWLVSKDKNTYCANGNHGFDNIYKSMQALFLAHGPGFRQKFETKPFDSIELYNVMCDLLGIEPAPNNGTPGALNHILHSPSVEPVYDKLYEYKMCDGNAGTDQTSLEACNCQGSVKISSVVQASVPFRQPGLVENIESCKLNNRLYSTGYGWEYKMPIWSSYVLNNTQSFSNVSGDFCILDDPRIPLNKSTTCDLYQNNTLTLTYAFLFHPNFVTSSENNEAQLSSNVVPMYEGFKEGIWRYVWRIISDYNKQDGSLSVTVGPVFDYNYDGLYDENMETSGDQKIHDVPIPTHYYVILIKCNNSMVPLQSCDESELMILSFVFPHVSKVPNCMPEEMYMRENVVRIRDIELLTGLRFLNNLPIDKASRLKTFLPTSLWRTETIAYSWTQLPCDDDNNGAQCPGKIPLLLISLDGFRAEYLQRKLTPVIQKMRECGVHAPYMRSVYPTVTFPNHYTIVTGLYPESHGILSNRMYDEEIGEVFTIGGRTKMDPRWWGGEPIWITAKKQGKKAATFFWPGSDVNVSGIYPDLWKLYDGQVGFPERVATVIDWLTLPEDERPDFITLYFDEPDHIAHQTGPNDDKVNDQLQTVDDMILRLMNALYHKDMHKCVNIIVIADHGFDSVRCDQVVKLPRYITNITDLLIFDGTFGRIQPKFHRLSQTGSNRYKVFPNENVRPTKDIVSEIMCQQREMKVFTKETIPRRFHYSNNPRMGPILLDIAERWLVSRTNSFYCSGGNHGWDNLNKAMHALFLAHGPAFRKRVETDSFENIELYNLMCEIMGITPANNNGTWGSLHHILDNPKPLEREEKAAAGELCRAKDVDLMNSKDDCMGQMNVTEADFLPSSTNVSSLPFGLPRGWNDSLCLLLYKATVTAYDDNLHLPMWTSTMLQGNGEKRNKTIESCIVHDVSIPPTKEEHYIDAGRDIVMGYLYPSDLVFTDKGKYIQLNSNIVPMYRNFKQGIWTFVWNLIEDYQRTFKTIQVLSGPIFDNDGDGIADNPVNVTQYRVNENSSVPLPSHYFIILVKCNVSTDVFPCPSGVNVQSFILPHTKTTPNCLNEKEFLRDNVARVMDIELLTGIEFLVGNFSVSERARLVTYLPVTLWPSALIQDWTASDPVQGFEETECPAVDTACSSDYKPVVLLSLDGFRADYLLRNATPNIKRLMKCGVHAPYMRSVFPTKTFPNHYSIVTGLYPESHGIIDNSMYDKNIGERFGLGRANASDPRWWGGEPIWNTLRKHNKISATFFWPGSDVKIGGSYPNYWKKYDGRIPYSARVQRVLSWIDLPEGSRPDFITLYFEEPDKEGHNDGPDGPKIQHALQKVDDAVGLLMTGLHDRDLHNCVNIIIIADHGMADTSCDRLISFRDYLTTTYNKYIYDGAFGRINPFYSYARSGPREVDNPDSVSSIMANLTCHPHFKAYLKQDLPARYHYVNNDRIDPIVVDVEDKWLVTFRSLRYYGEKYCRGGNHGYDNRYKSMRALFLAHGPAFKQNVTVDSFENIELYNLISDILHIAGAPNNGTRGSLNHLLSHPPLPEIPVSFEYNRTYQKFATKEYKQYINTLKCMANCPKHIPHKLDQIDHALYVASTAFAHDVSADLSPFVPYGLPRLVNEADVHLLYQTSFLTGFRKEIRSPIWVAYSLSKTTISPRENVRSSCMLPDLRLENRDLTSGPVDCSSQPSSLDKNYTMTSLLSQASETDNQMVNIIGLGFLSSVAVPMLPEFHKGVWRELHKMLEKWVSTYEEINVMTGPIYDSNTDGLPDELQLPDGDIPIPTHFYVIVTRCNVKQGRNCSDITPISFILPHKTKVSNCQSYEEYLIDHEARVRDVELVTGLEFFSDLDFEVSIKLRTFLSNGLW